MYSIPDFANLGKNGGYGGMPAGGMQQDFGSLGGTSSTSNQYMNFPSMTMPSTGGPLDMGTPATPQPSPAVSAPPGVVPPSQFPLPGDPLQNPNNTLLAGVGGNLPGGAATGRTIDPQFTSEFAQYLMGMLGKGATPFNLSTTLPSTGQTTAPGQLTAPDNPILQALQQFYTTGTGGPLPGVLPMWQSEMKSMQLPIEQQLANIKEQFGARGALGSTEMATALEQYGSQTAADQESLLGQLTLQALPGMEQAGVNQQTIDQGSIDRMLQEFIRTQPENSPLLGMESGFATTFSPIYGKTGFGASFGSSFGSALGGGLGSLITGQ
jgi:hypothetical protein